MQPQTAQEVQHKSHQHVWSPGLSSFQSLSWHRVTADGKQAKSDVNVSTECSAKLQNMENLKWIFSTPQHTRKKGNKKQCSKKSRHGWTPPPPERKVTQAHSPGHVIRRLSCSESVKGLRTVTHLQWRSFSWGQSHSSKRHWFITKQWSQFHLHVFPGTDNQGVESEVLNLLTKTQCYFQSKFFSPLK